MTSAKDMGVNFKRYADDLGVTLESFLQEFGNELTKQVLMNTPVDTGFLRASWYVSLNTPMGAGRGEFEKVPGEGAAPPVTVSRMSLALNSMKPGDTVYIMNGAEYAAHLEFGTRNMPPRAFVRRTAAQAPQLAESAAAFIRSRRS